MSTERFRILVADPNLTVRQLLSLIFADRRYRLEFAADGEEALGHAMVDPPALVITEMRLDRLDGALLCEQLKNHPRTASVKVLFLTTSVSEWALRRARRAGADGYLTKPFSPSVLLRQVNEILGVRPEEVGSSRPELPEKGHRGRTSHL